MHKIAHASKGFAPILWVIIAAVLIGGGYSAYRQYTNVVDDDSGQEMWVLKQEMANWKTYRNELYGFEFRYPQGVKVDVHLYSPVGGTNPILGGKFPELIGAVEGGEYTDEYFSIDFLVFPRVQDLLREVKKELPSYSEVTVNFLPKYMVTFGKKGRRKTYFQNQNYAFQIEYENDVCILYDPASSECVKVLSREKVTELQNQILSTFRFTK